MSLGQPFLEPNCKALWHLDGNSNDSSAGAHNGTDTAITYSQANGKFGQGAGFDGDSSKIILTDHADLKPTGNFTVGTWVKMDTVSAVAMIFQSFSAGTKYAGIVLYINASGQFIIYSYKNTGSVENTDWAKAISPSDYDDNLWHFVVGTGDGATLKIYVDGDLKATTTWANNPVYAATNYVRIGVQNNAGSDLAETYLNGALDEVFLINGTAWTDQQIRRWYGHSKGML